MTVNGYTYKVGDLFTTLKSKKTGVIKEIIPNASGSVRVRKPSVMKCGGVALNCQTPPL